MLTNSVDTGAAIFTRIRLALVVNVKLAVHSSGTCHASTYVAGRGRVTRATVLTREAVAECVCVLAQLSGVSLRGQIRTYT